VNSILYQRCIYPREEFEKVTHYGVPLVVSKNNELLSYIQASRKQLSEWLKTGEIKKLVVVISSQETNETRERWTFDVHTNSDSVTEKPLPEIQSEIRSIMRQVCASITYLPLLDTPCKFELLVHTTKDTITPLRWVESDPRLISNPEQVKLQSFNTKVSYFELANLQKIHYIEPTVAYQVGC